MALGATRARTVMTVILPTAVGGIVTATIVAVARAAGETAPLLFTTSIFVGTTVNTDPSQAMASIPMVIFSYSESPDPHAQQQAWAAALVLVAVVLVGSIVGQVAVPPNTPPDRAGQMSRFSTSSPRRHRGITLGVAFTATINEYVDRERARSRRKGGRLPAGGHRQGRGEPVPGQARRAGRAAHARFPRSSASRSCASTVSRSRTQGRRRSAMSPWTSSATR